MTESGFDFIKFGENTFSVADIAALNLLRLCTPTAFIPLEVLYEGLKGKFGDKITAMNMQMIKNKGGITSSLSTLSGYLRKLEWVGLIEKFTEEDITYYSLTDYGKNLVGITEETGIKPHHIRFSRYIIGNIPKFYVFYRIYAKEAVEPGFFMSFDKKILEEIFPELGKLPQLSDILRCLSIYGLITRYGRGRRFTQYGAAGGIPELFKIYNAFRKITRAKMPRSYSVKKISDITTCDSLNIHILLNAPTLTELNIGMVALITALKTGIKLNDIKPLFLTRAETGRLIKILEYRGILKKGKSSIYGLTERGEKFIEFLLKIDQPIK